MIYHVHSFCWGEMAVIPQQGHKHTHFSKNQTQSQMLLWRFRFFLQQKQSPVKKQFEHTRVYPTPGLLDALNLHRQLVFFERNPSSLSSTSLQLSWWSSSLCVSVMDVFLLFFHTQKGGCPNCSTLSCAKQQTSQSVSSVKPISLMDPWLRRMLAGEVDVCLINK